MLSSSLERRSSELELVYIAPYSSRQYYCTVVVCPILVVITWIVVALRLYTRISLRRIVGWDDWVMLLCVIIFTAFQACVLSIVISIGLENPTLTAQTMTFCTTIMIAAESFYLWCIVLMKISLGIFFLRVLTERWQRRAVYFLVGLTTTLGVGYFFYAVFQCGVPNLGLPIWTKQLMGICITHRSVEEGIGYTYAALNVLTDISFVALPIPMVRSARIAYREKCIVISIFVIAVFGCVASIVRVAWISALSNTTNTFWVQIWDLTIWSTVECGLTIIATSAATLRPLLQAIHSKISSSISIFGQKTSTDMESNTTTLKGSGVIGSTTGKIFNERSVLSSNQFSDDISTVPSPTKTKNSRRGETFLLDATVRSIDIASPTATTWQSGNGAGTTLNKEDEKSVNRDVEAIGESSGATAWYARDSSEEELADSEMERRARWWPLPRATVFDSESSYSIHDRDAT